MTTVLLLSDKSSGSTALQSALLAHPEVRAVEHTMHTSRETLWWAKAASLLGADRADWAEGRAPFLASEARRDLRELLRSNAPGAPLPATDEALVWDGWERVSRAHGPVFFEKSPHHLVHWAATSLLLRWALTTDQEIRVIGLVRNPLAVLHSAWSRWLTPPSEREAVWARAQRNLLAARATLGPERFTLVRYEDLVREPARELAALAAFCGLAPHDGLGETLHARSADKWSADPTFALELAPETAALAEALGFTAAELANPGKPGLDAATARRQRWARTVRNTRGQVRRRIVRPLLGR